MFPTAPSSATLTTSSAIVQRGASAGVEERMRARREGQVEVAPIWGRRDPHPNPLRACPVQSVSPAVPFEIAMEAIRGHYRIDLNDTGNPDSASLGFADESGVHSKQYRKIF